MQPGTRGLCARLGLIAIALRFLEPLNRVLVALSAMSEVQIAVADRCEHSRWDAAARRRPLLGILVDVTLLGMLRPAAFVPWDMQ
jgi:hypothetical protein